MSLRVLALNPYHGGSHRAFLEGWMAHSRHAFTVLALPAYKWKWRMRHAAVTFARQLAERDAAEWDALFCTDMLNLAEFRGLCSAEVRELPSVVYFHENQLTYPSRTETDRDLHFGFTNITTALVADAVWFNSAYHRNAFLTAAVDFVRRMPDFPPLEEVDRIREKSAVFPPGVVVGEVAGAKPADGPLRIVWVSRWEHDKDPETFFTALRLLKESGADFHVNVLGESFGSVPECFERARVAFAAHVERWGFAESRTDYEAALRESDVVVSTARHEFFGIGIVEAVAAGCWPLVPRRLAYPEVLGDAEEFYHDGTAADVARRLLRFASTERLCELRQVQRLRLPGRVSRFAWPSVVESLDGALQTVRL